MSVHRHHRPAGAEAVALGVEIPVERIVVDATLDASLFVRFAGGGIGMGCIAVNTTLGESPAAAAGANQKKFRLVSLQAIANCSHMYAFACGIGVDICWPCVSPGTATVNRV